MLDLGLVHDHDFVGDLERLFLVVGDEKRRELNLLVKTPEPASQFFADLGVECAEGLVEEQHLGLDRERAREGDALTLAAGELTGETGVEALELHEFQQPMHAVRDVTRRRAIAARPDVEAEGDVLKNRHVPEQRVMLKHKTDVAFSRRHARHVFTVKRDAPSTKVRLIESGDDAQQRSFSGARRPE